MKKLFKPNRNDIPLYCTTLLFLVVLILWFFPNILGLISERYSLAQYRSDLKDLAQLFYILVTFWLVMVTRKMAEVSLNSQKAMNRPEVLCELFISSEKPAIMHFNGIKNMELRNTSDSEYDEELQGANVFLIIKNRYNGGKAINLTTDSYFEAKNPERILLPRKIEIDYIAEGDCVAFYLYRYERPSSENCSLKLVNCLLSFTTPFNEASKDQYIEISYNNNNPILATGNHVGAIKLDGGIRTNN
ncbi:MAG TPA: hypothetical protein VK179_16385 [Bacteroidales bacterium]|nr:hypothetical protein [Bacteroidales bacterium]